MAEVVLYGVGVGPGAPDLLTLRARDVMRSVSVLACPRGSDFGESMAFKIAKPSLDGVAAQERLFLTFPMSKDPERVRPAVEQALEAIAARLEAGKSVAFLTEGDPSTFSSFIYVRRGIERLLPEVRIEVVPGVSSIMAVPAVSGRPLADGQERVAIIPGTYGVDDLDDLIARFDTVVLMKVGREIATVVRVLERHGLLDRAVYVSRATMREQRIERDLTRVRDEHGDCFAMIIVRRDERSGLLMGESNLAALTPLLAQEQP